VRSAIEKMTGGKLNAPAIETPAPDPTR
jgi:hypothetical protein